MLALPILLVAGTASSDSSVEGAVGRALHALAVEKSPKVRTQAVLALRDDADEPRVRNALIEALSDGSPLVRAAAANVLGTLAGPHGYESLCGAARDPDPLVARWAGWAVRRTLAMAPRVKVRVKGLKSPGRDKADELAKAYQDGVLKALLADVRFDVATSMDFDDEVPEGDRIAFFGLALPGVKVPVVTVSLVGRVVTDGDRKAATASASLRVEVPGGFPAFELAAEARGIEGPQPPPDPFADEFSIPKERDDARVVAAEAVGRAVGARLVGAFAPEAVRPVEAEEGRAERNRRRGR